MKKISLFLVALIGLSGLVSQTVNVGSAVAIEPRHYKMVTSYGHPEAIAVQRAIEKARQLFGEGWGYRGEDYIEMERLTHSHVGEPQ